MRRSLVIGIISGLAAVSGAVAAPAKADCVRAEVVVLWSNGTEQVLWPQERCIVETGYPTNWTNGGTINKEGVPSGLPSGVRVQVWAQV